MGGAVVDGAAAVVLDVFLRRRHDAVVEMMVGMPPEVQQEFADARNAIRAAAETYKDGLPQPTEPAETGPQSEHDYVSTDQAAGIMGITARRVRQMAADGSLAAKRERGRWLVLRAAAEQDRHAPTDGAEE